MSGKSFDEGMNKAQGGAEGQKGYARVPTPEQATGIAAGLGGWAGSREVEDHAAGSGFALLAFRPLHELPRALRPLVAFPIYDGASYDLEEFFHRHIQDLDEASGEFLYFVDIGHPEQSGKQVRELITQLRLGKSFRRLGDAYILKVLSRGLEHDHRREAMQELAADLAIPRDAIPVLAVATPRGVHETVWLKIEREWYSTREGQILFGQALREWAALPSLREAAVERLWGHTLTARVEQSFDVLRARIEELRNEAIDRTARAQLFPGVGWATTKAEASLEVTVRGMEGGRPSYGSIVIKGREVALTPTQFRFVLRLVQDAGKTVSQESLHRSAGEFPDAKSTRPSTWAKTHMRDIRRAFEQSGISEGESHTLLRTDRKGYRLTLEKSQIYPSV